MDLLLQMQADQLGVTVRRPTDQETTALGAAFLAGLAEGVWPSLDAVGERWELDAEFAPTGDDMKVLADLLHAQWTPRRRAIAALGLRRCAAHRSRHGLRAGGQTRRQSSGRRCGRAASTCWRSRVWNGRPLRPTTTARSVRGEPRPREVARGAGRLLGLR